MKSLPANHYPLPTVVTSVPLIYLQDISQPYDMESTELLEVVRSFTDLESLLFYVEILGLDMEDPIIAERIAELNRDLPPSRDTTSPQPGPSADISSNDILEDVLKSFTDVDSLMAFVRVNGIDQRSHVVRHQIEQLQIKKKTINCKRCRLQCRDAKDLDQHNKLCHKRAKGLRCRRCNLYFNSHKLLYSHNRTTHRQYGGASSQHSPPWDNNSPPWGVPESNNYDKPLEEVYSLHSDIILRGVIHGSASSMYNFPLTNGFTLQQLSTQLNSIFEEQSQTFRLNMAFGYILRNIDNGTYRYFRANHTDQISERPWSVSSAADVAEIETELQSLNITDYILRQRPNTKWTPHLITNVTYWVTPTGFTLGVGQIELPKYLVSSKFLTSLTHYKGRAYVDRLCAFRCLTFHKHKALYPRQTEFESAVQYYYKQWMEYIGDDCPCTDYAGLELDDMPGFEQCFQISVNVYEHQEDGVSIPMYLSMCKHNDAMHLNHYDGHLSYITSIHAYSKKLKCANCTKLFSDVSNHRRHQKTCKNTSRRNYYPGGFFKAKTNLFEELEEYGFKVPEADRFFPWFIVFDMESLLIHPQREDTHATKWINQHKPVSVSVCSNVPQFNNPRCIINADRNELVKEMFTYFESIRQAMLQLSMQKWGWVILRLRDALDRWTSKCSDSNTAGDGDLEEKSHNTSTENFNENTACESGEYEPPSAEFLYAMSKENVYMRFLKELDSGVFDVTYNDWEPSNDNDCINLPDSIPKDIESDHITCNPIEQDNPRVARLMRKRLTQLLLRVNQYCNEITVLGFNSSFYDLRLVIEKVAQSLEMESAPQSFVIKDAKGYSCLSNRKFRFLDIIRYLAPHTSYSQFLRAFGIEEQKGFFPYEWFDDVSKLENTSLPPLGELWYSKLRGKSVLDDGVKSVEENYAWLMQEWEKHEMKTFSDFLQWYNNLDVTPFVLAVIRLQDFYRERGIDPFKDSISLPGIAREMMFKSAKKYNASFSLIDYRNADLHDTIKANIVGGPSIIFNRYHKVGQTYIRGDPQKPCSKVLGLDANSLYVHCINKQMPCGPFIRRRSTNYFRPEKRDRYVQCYNWLDWEAQRGARRIIHRQNSGREKRIGPYPVDGYDPDRKTVYQFHGCYYHGHTCYLTSHITDVEWIELASERYEDTIAATAYIEEKGYEVIEMWECHFSTFCQSHPTLQQFIEQRQPSFTKSHKGSVTEKQILDAVVEGTLFGMVEVDIGVEDFWGRYTVGNHQNNYTPYDYFSEMSPLFQNIHVPFEAIGTHMQDHVRENGLSEKPRRLLVGVMHARKILLATPLLQWYLIQGLHVNKVYQVIEYSPLACFTEFVRDVVEGRRAGDQDSTKALISDTMKLLGNAAYGSMLLDKAKHHTIKYVRGYRKAVLKANSSRFLKLTELDPENEYYELELQKQQIRHDMPIQIGFFILQYAKLHMLEFYYNFLMQYLEKKDFEFCQMDTDSAYFAIAGPTLQSVIKPCMLKSYEQSMQGFCSDQIRDHRLERQWFPRTCCTHHAQYDKRTTGLMKQEFSGDEIIGLCSKSYIIAETTVVVGRATVSPVNRYCSKKIKLARRRLGRFYHKVRANKNHGHKRSILSKKIARLQRNFKFSSKGINRHSLKTPLFTFRKVLTTMQGVTGFNRGFMVRDNVMYTYEQKRNAFTYFYCKREVLEDGRQTLPLKLVL